jgi:hypothetical protein
MKRIKRCETCRHAIPAYDGPTDKPYVVCSLIPPAPIVTARLDPETKLPVAVVQWTRPSMALEGWCGQHRLSLRRLFGYGTRA